MGYKQEPPHLKVCFFELHLFIYFYGPGEMAPWLRALTALAKVLSLFPNTMEGGSQPPVPPAPEDLTSPAPQVHVLICTYPHTGTHAHT